MQERSHNPKIETGHQNTESAISEDQSQAFGGTSRAKMWMGWFGLILAGTLIFQIPDEMFVLFVILSLVSYGLFFS